MEIQAADRKLRTVAIIILLLLAMLAFAAVMLLERWIDGVQELPAELAISELRLALFWLLFAGCLSMAAFGAWLWRLGNAIQNAQRFPLPGARLIRDTRVLTGYAAIRRSRLARAIGVFLILAAVALAVISWRGWAMLVGAGA